MVASAISKPKVAFRGIRPFSARSDLYGVARLLEEAFRGEHNFPFADFPLMREIGIVLWTLNYAPTFPETFEGFVWIEDGKIVGNATLTADLVRGNRYYISNVAVKREYQRRGIARELMRASLEHIRRQHASSVLLNVRPQNQSAITLYQDLGFKKLEMRGQWTLGTLPLRFPPANSTTLRSLRMSDARAVTELVRAATPANVQPFRPRQNEFEITWDERFLEFIGDSFIGRTTQRWVLERDHRIAALLLIRGQHLAGTHRVVIETHPDFRGGVENELIAVAWRELEKMPAREIRADATSAYPELIAALEHHGFRFSSGMTLMEKVIGD
ncbi:MAG: GNAT family N-acetyltransferase [Anaerolineales bacterium]|nr:GNAT family N-acetyltransferase [Anaerolineales bacterium]